jgi:hypothetical protein
LPRRKNETWNLLGYLAAIITPWIDLLAGCLECGDCALSMTDSTTAEGWMRKSNFENLAKTPSKPQFAQTPPANMPDYLWMQK